MTDNIENVLSYHGPKEGQPGAYDALRNKARETKILRGKTIPESRERSLARTKPGGMFCGTTLES